MIHNSVIRDKKEDYIRYWVSTLVPYDKRYCACSEYPIFVAVGWKRLNSPDHLQLALCVHFGLGYDHCLIADAFDDGADMDLDAGDASNTGTSPVLAVLSQLMGKI